MRLLNRSIALIFLSLTSVCFGAEPVALTEADAQFAQLERDYVVYSMQQFPVMATYLGGAAYDPALRDIDGKLRDYSGAALQQEDVRLTQFRDRFTALRPEALSARRRIDRNVARAQIAFLLHQHQTRRLQERSLDSYVDEPFRGVDWQIQGMTQTGAGTYGTEGEWRHVVERVRAMPAYLATAEKQLAAGVAAHNTPDWRMLRQIGLGTTLADAEYFSKTLPELAKSNMPAAGSATVLADLGTASRVAAAAYEHLRQFIAAAFFDDAAREGPAALKPPFRADRYAMGAAEYDWAVQNNLQLKKTSAQLFEESWPVVERTQKTLIALARQIAASHKWQTPGDGAAVVRAVFQKLGQDAPKTDDEMLEGYRQAGVRLVDYARRTGLFDVPAQYKLDVTFTPPPLRSGFDGAAYYPAPPFKETGVGRFYVTPTGDNIAMLRASANKSALADLAAHEGFPGHDWNYKVMAQYREEISAIRWLTPGAVEDSSSMWEDSMSSEGWGLYSEALVAEPQPGAPEGFYTPEEHLYQLQGQLYRDLRVRLDTGLHTGRISFDEGVTMFSQVVDFLPGSCKDARALRLNAKVASCKGAQSAIDRYARWPTQAITYRLGKEAIIALRGRAQQQLGAQYSAKRFHIEFMKQGSIPAGYFGDELLRVLGSTH